VSAKLEAGCECNVSCFLTLDAESVYRHRLNIAELTKNEQDFYLMGIVRAVLMDKNDKGSKRQRKRSSYSYMGKKVCLYAFLYLENITIYQLKKIRSHVQRNGVVAIEHGNSHKIPHNAFSLDLYKKVETFLRSYLNVDKQHSSANKSIVLTQPLSKVYQEYLDHDKDSSTKQMGYTTFRTFFKKQFPQVRMPNQQLKPATLTTKPIQVIEEHLVEATVGTDGELIFDHTNTDDLIYYDAELSHEEIVN